MPNIEFVGNDTTPIGEETIVLEPSRLPPIQTNLVKTATPNADIDKLIEKVETPEATSLDIDSLITRLVTTKPIDPDLLITEETNKVDIIDQLITKVDEPLKQIDQMITNIEPFEPIITVEQSPIDR